MDDDQDARDRERRLVKMTSDEFARGINAAFSRTAQEWANRQGLLLVVILLLAVALGLWRYFSG